MVQCTLDSAQALHAHPPLLTYCLHGGQEAMNRRSFLTKDMPHPSDFQKHVVLFCRVDTVV